MFIQLLVFLPLVTGHWWERNCYDCELKPNYDEADKLQSIAYVSSYGAGEPHWIDMHKAKTNGIVLENGQACETPCVPFWSYKVHGCKASGFYDHPQECARYNRDIYGRECEEIKKDATLYGTWCYVKNRNKYWRYNGGTWGRTHFPVCRSDSTMCFYGRASL